MLSFYFWGELHFADKLVLSQLYYEIYDRKRFFQVLSLQNSKKNYQFIPSRPFLFYKLFFLNFQFKKLASQSSHSLYYNDQTTGNRNHVPCELSMNGIVRRYFSVWWKIKSNSGERLIPLESSGGGRWGQFYVNFLHEHILLNSYP